MWSISRTFVKWCHCRRRRRVAYVLIFGTVFLLGLWVLLTQYGEPESPSDDPQPRVLKSIKSKIQAFQGAVQDLSKSSNLNERFPKYMIIGFGKAGTRALYDLLRLHPKLVGPSAELRFFSRKNYSSRAVRSRYLSLIPRPSSGGYTIEKSPDYIITSEAPVRIAESAEKLKVNSSKLKFIVVLRDPVDRAMSEYLEWVALRRKNHGPQLPSFERMVWNESFPGYIDYSQPFINTSCYAQHIRRWFKTFPREQCCFVDGDNFTKYPYQEVHKLEECLGLPHYFKLSHFVYNKSRKLFCFKVPGRKVKCGKKSKGREHPEIPKPVLEKLREYFEPWNLQLPELIGHSWRRYNGSDV